MRFLGIRFPRSAFALALAALSVGAAQAALVPSPVVVLPVKGWAAVAGMSGAEVVELARALPVETDAAGDRPWCDTGPVIHAALTAEFDETLVSRRVDGTQLWGSDVMGTWTVLLERADSTHCVIASGIGYRDGVDPGTFYANVGLS